MKIVLLFIAFLLAGCSSHSENKPVNVVVKQTPAPLTVKCDKTPFIPETWGDVADLYLIRDADFERCAAKVDLLVK